MIHLKIALSINPYSCSASSTKLISLKNLIFLVCFPSLSAPSFFQKLFTQSNHARVSYWPIRRRHFWIRKRGGATPKSESFYFSSRWDENNEIARRGTRYRSNQKCDITDFYLTNWDTVLNMNHTSMNDFRKPYKAGGHFLWTIDYGPCYTDRYTDRILALTFLWHW